VHVCNPSTQKTETEESVFCASLGYIARTCLETNKKGIKQLTVPPVHQPPSRCPVASGGEWVPYGRAQVPSVSIITESSIGWHCPRDQERLSTKLILCACVHVRMGEGWIRQPVRTKQQLALAFFFFFFFWCFLLF
jgi:hypothetical protein